MALSHLSDEALLAGLATIDADCRKLLARLVVYQRPGSVLTGVSDAVLARTTLVDGPGLDLSATELRGRIAAGLSVRYLVPDAVVGYIAAHGLYGAR